MQEITKFALSTIVVGLVAMISGCGTGSVDKQAVTHNPAPATVVLGPADAIVHWGWAKSIDSPVSYKEHLRAYPNSQFFSEARTALIKACEKSVSANNDSIADCSSH